VEYPFTLGDMNTDLRSPKQFLEQGNRASELIQQNPAMCVNVKGVLGYSVFSLLPFFPVPRYSKILSNT
jgi:hypothetical protein